MKAFGIFYLFYFAGIASAVECENHSQPISYMSTKGNPRLSVIDADSFYDDLAELLIFFVRPFRLGIIIIHPPILRGGNEEATTLPFRHIFSSFAFSRSNYAQLPEFCSQTDIEKKSYFQPT